MDIAASGPEVPILYGLLNASDSVQYIKLNKVFLNKNESAFQTAMNKDSLYLSGNIEVTLIENNAGSIRKTILDTVSKAKESGIFAGPNQLLYLVPKSSKINPLYSYSIEVKSKSNNSILCSASTGIVGDIKILKPQSADTTLPFVIFYRFNEYFKQQTQWQQASKAFLYDGVLRFYYDEIDTLSGDSVRLFVDWPYFRGLEAGTQTNVPKEMEGELFYKYLSTQIKEKANVIRYGLPVFDLEIYAAGEDLSNYIRISGPSYFLSDIKPIYTNVKNGYGILSSRNYKKIKVQTDNPSMLQLERDPNTSNLGFRHRN